MTEEKKAPAKKTAAKKTAAPKAPAKPRTPKPKATEEVTPLIGAVTPPAPASEVNQAPAKKKGFFMKLFGGKKS